MLIVLFQARFLLMTQVDMLVVLFQARYLTRLYVSINCVMLLRNKLFIAVTIPKVQRRITRQSSYFGPSLSPI